MAHEQGNGRSSVVVWSDWIACFSLVVAGTLWPLSPALKEVGVVIALLAWLVSKITSRTMPPHLVVTLPLTLWFVSGLLSMVHSVSLPASIRGLEKILKATAILFMAADVMRTPRRIVALLGAMMIGAAIVSLDGLVQFVSGVDLFYRHPAGIAMNQVPRLTATFGHANDFGVYGVGVLPICLAMALSATRPRTRMWSWVVVVLLGLALVLTFSRGAALGIVVSLLVFGVIQRAWRILIAATVIGGMGVLCLPSPVLGWVSGQASWFDALVLPDRPQIWQTAWAMIKAHPIIGVGVNTFVLNYSRYKLPGDVIRSAYAHNHYLHLAAELGFIGLVVFGWFLVRTANVWRGLLRSNDRWVKLTSTGLGCGIIAFLVIGLLESALYSSHTNFGFWSWLGMLHGMGLREPQRCHAQ